MTCEDARKLIEENTVNPELTAHLTVCESCRDEQALWNLLGEAAGLEPGLDFTERVLERVRMEERQVSSDFPEVGRHFAFSGTLDEFADFPSDSFGAIIFHSWR